MATGVVRLGQMKHMEKLELSLHDEVGPVILEIPEMNKITMSQHVLGINDELGPVMVVSGVLPDKSGDDDVLVSNKLPGSPDGATPKPAALLTLDVSLADMTSHLGTGTATSNTWATESGVGDEGLHHALLVGAVGIRTVQPLGARGRNSSLRCRTNVSRAGTAPRVALDHLNVLVGMGGVQSNTL